MLTSLSEFLAVVFDVIVKLQVICFMFVLLHQLAFLLLFINYLAVRHGKILATSWILMHRLQLLRFHKIVLLSPLDHAAATHIALLDDEVVRVGLGDCRVFGCLVNLR